MSEEENNNQEENGQQEEPKKDELAPDDTYKDTPVFDVTQSEFFRNMRQDRNRMRFSNNSKPSKFMQQTKHRKPFYMRYTDNKNGEKFIKRIK